MNLKQIPGFTLTPDKILSLADSLYNELKIIGNWTSINNKASESALLSKNLTLGPNLPPPDKYVPI